MKGHLEENVKDKETEKIRQHFKNKISNLTTRHLCYCPDMCNIIDYNVEITESDYDWPRKMATLGIDVTDDEEGYDIMFS